MALRASLGVYQGSILASVDARKPKTATPKPLSPVPYTSINRTRTPDACYPDVHLLCLMCPLRFEEWGGLLKLLVLLQRLCSRHAAARVGPEYANLTLKVWIPAQFNVDDG